MHLEVLVEDASGKIALETLLPKVLGLQDAPHTWRIHAYKGIGRIPKNLQGSADPSKRMLLDQLPRLLAGYARTPGVDAVMVVLDRDTRPCADFLTELKAIAALGHPNTLFRLAIEEMEAWYFGDLAAVKKAYPHAKAKVLNAYIQDSVCGTWEMLADALYAGGAAAIKKQGWPLSGQLKCEWAGRISPYMDVDANLSPSFRKLSQGLRRLAMNG
ncbi:MAG: hypothetical protein B7Y41_12725 [Hydrogenophilales bacterium 28-61-23]|nr:MAG: hypothetical protein B7Y41_12725 [Hydrogenophilales bacterium 28-61-23]